MNLELLLPLLVTASVAIAGWFVAHRFSTDRDRANKQRDIRVNYLIQAYRDIGMAAQRPPNSEQFNKLESAFHDVQLFGTPAQLDKLQSAIVVWKTDGGADMNDLLSDLRDDLRKELNLPKSDASLVFFRARK